MANARKCDICHNYYDVPEIKGGVLDSWDNTSMVRILRLDPNGGKTIPRHDIMHFDACEKCLQDVLDYILARGAESSR